jgi:hypothetical protein
VRKRRKKGEKTHLTDVEHLKRVVAAVLDFYAGKVRVLEADPELLLDVALQRNGVSVGAEEGEEERGRGVPRRPSPHPSSQTAACRA